MLPAHHCPGSDRVSECLSCNGVILVEERGHSPRPPPQFYLGVRESVTFLRSLYLASYPEESITFLRSLYVAGYPKESITFLLVVVASSSSPLFSVMVGPMSVLSMLSPLLRSAKGRMTSDQPAKSSFVKINMDSQDRIRLLLIPYR